MKYAACAAMLVLCAPFATDAFCGFYVAKADAKLYNKASRVVVAHHEDKTVVTMASDYEGDPKEFAVVIPVPEVITKEQVHITENALVDHVDAYTAPRLVEYFDEDPCRPMLKAMPMAMAAGVGASRAKEALASDAAALGVKIEEQYTVGEYDILILSATQSDGLQTWLKQEGYKIPDGASEVLASYINQSMKFFVAKVNLSEQAKRGGSFLRPIQVAYESRKFMLPIRLGTVNADGPQELFIYMLTEGGRVETTNYRTVKIPTGDDVPLFVKNEFGNFYKAMFDTQEKKNDMHTVFLEYAWNMNACDPCSADPIPQDKLRELGAFWMDDNSGSSPLPPRPMPMNPSQGNTSQGNGGPMIAWPVRPIRRFPGMGGTNVFITRLHVRYDREHFPEDLMFEETPNSENFQGRYVLRHPWTGESSCQAGDEYRQNLPVVFGKQAENLAALTGWDISTIRQKMEKNGQSFTPSEVKPVKWYERLWPDQQQ